MSTPASKAAAKRAPARKRKPSPKPEPQPERTLRIGQVIQSLVLTWDDGTDLEPLPPEQQPPPEAFSLRDLPTADDLRAKVEVINSQYKASQAAQEQHAREQAAANGDG